MSPAESPHLEALRIPELTFDIPQESNDAWVEHQAALKEKLDALEGVGASIASILQSPSVRPTVSADLCRLLDALQLRIESEEQATRREYSLLPVSGHSADPESFLRAAFSHHAQPDV